MENNESKASVESVPEGKSALNSCVHFLLDLPIMVASATWKATKIIVFAAFLGIVFYAGMYFQSAVVEKQDVNFASSYLNLKEKVEYSLRDTTNQPILVVVPEHSWYEKAKLTLGYKLPERERITISTDVFTSNLGIVPPEDPGTVDAALKFWGDSASNTWNWWSSKVNFMN